MPKQLFKIGLSKIHQQGLFATDDIKAGVKIVQYLGEQITKEESNRRALEWEASARESDLGRVYVFELNENWDIDGRVGDNPARYMNHSCDDNCEAVNYDGEAIWLVARRDISKGEELVFDYGYSMEHFLDHPCNCGAKNCIGYIVHEDQRRKVKRLIQSRKLPKPLQQSISL